MKQMKKNVGSTDSAIRIVVALAIVVLFAKGMLSGTVALIAGIVAVIFIVTGLAGTCPIYSLTGLSTNKKKNL